MLLAGALPQVLAATLCLAAAPEETSRTVPAVAPGGAPRLGPLPPLVRQLPWNSPALVPHPSGCHLPLATAGRDLRAAEAGAAGYAARWQASRLRPTADRPEIAWPSALLPRALWLTAATPPARVASADGGRAAATGGQIGPDAVRSNPATDPAWQETEKRILGVPAELHEKSAPLVRLTIPDPFEDTTALRLRQPPPDTDPPAPSYELPPRPPMPVKK
jgi:hypothetical protein